MATTAMIDATTDEDVFAPEQLNELGEEGLGGRWSIAEIRRLIAWPVVLLKRPLD